jgi:small subunit ribosomal protein S15
MLNALAQWKTHPTDVGSTQVQVARLSERIKYLTAHQAKNKKDKSTERGLVLLANRRRKLLKYLINEDIAVFEKISAAYGIRTRKIVEESMGVVRRTKSRSAGGIE